VVRNRREAVANTALYNLRDERGETQEQTALALNALAAARGEATAITGNQVSRWERGISHPSPVHRQLLSAHYGVTVAELGLTRPRLHPTGPAGPLTAGVMLSLGTDDVAMPDARMAQSQDEWLHTRRALNSHHVRLARTAAQLYPPTDRFGDTGLIARPQWLFPQPPDLADIRLSLLPAASAPTVTGTDERSRAVRPLLDADRRYSRYSHAIRDIAKPRLLENRSGWRLLDLRLSPGEAPVLVFGDTTYFDAIDVCEAVAHEAVLTHVTGSGELAPASWRGLSFRRLLGDPFDLARRPVLPSTDTLTIRASEDGASFVLHNRDSGSVASSGGMLGVMPSGTFQPSTIRAVRHDADFDLWRNIMREYSEEFLGNPEHTGDGSTIDYDTEPFRALDAGRRAGTIRAYCFGLALDALTLWAEILTVVVFDADVYDEVFADMVNANTEGSVVRIGTARPTPLIPFTRQVLDELSASGRLAPEAAGCLTLAWEHRRRILTG
jgi:transcriptional regulator with XRE-family HTH domain